MHVIENFYIATLSHSEFPNTKSSLHLMMWSNFTVFYPVHTVSFDWFLSRLEWILNLVLFSKTFDILPEIIIEYQI